MIVIPDLFVFSIKDDGTEWQSISEQECSLMDQAKPLSLYTPADTGARDASHSSTLAEALSILLSRE